MVTTIHDLKKELEKYDDSLEVYYATNYALVPLEVKKLDDRCVCIDMNTGEKHKYKEY